MEYDHDKSMLFQALKSQIYTLKPIQEKGMQLIFFFKVKKNNKQTIQISNFKWQKLSTTQPQVFTLPPTSLMKCFYIIIWF